MVVALLISGYAFQDKWLASIDSIEKSNSAKKYLENAKSSQEQMMLKGDANLFSAYISTELAVEDQYILNKIYYELKNNENLDNNLVADGVALCTYMHSILDHIEIADCIGVINTNYNFISMNSSGAEIEVDAEYADALSYVNKMSQSGYAINGTKASLSNNSLYKFDSSLKEIENIASGERNYVDNNVVNYENNSTLTVDSIKLSELNNIINTSMTNNLSLNDNIIETGTTTKFSTMKKMIADTDSNGNVISLMSAWDKDAFNDVNQGSNLNMVNSFKSNKSTISKPFSLFR